MPPAYVSDLLQPSSSLRLLGKGQPQTVKGKFRFSAWEPNPVSFLSSSYGASNGSLTILSVNMEFQLTHDEPLPTINRISRKLLAQTATHTVPFRESSAGPVCKSKKKAETHSVRLSDLKLSPVQWVQHGLATVIGRETQALVARAEDCGNGSKNCIDTATIEVPIMSPQHESVCANLRFLSYIPILCDTDLLFLFSLKKDYQVIGHQSPGSFPNNGIELINSNLGFSDACFLRDDRSKRTCVWKIKLNKRMSNEALTFTGEHSDKRGKLPGARG